MKKRYLNSILSKIWASLILLMIFSSGCNKDFFSKQPLDAVSDGTFWKTAADAQLALVGCYATTYNAGTQDFFSYRGLLFLDFIAGEGNDKANVTEGINSGNVNSADANILSYWQNAYSKVATCNNFLDHIGQINMDATTKATMIAEVRSIRAYVLFNVALYWGDVPMPEHLLTVSQANSITQTKQADVWAFAESELQAASAALPLTRPTAEAGRWTAGAALAILGRVQMAEKKWSDAAATYKKIIDSNVYSIDPHYAEMFWQEYNNKSPEVILATQYLTDLYAISLPLYYFPVAWGGWHQFAPFNNLVRDFGCKDGLPITQSPLFDPNHPYNNRDPRMDYNFFISNRTIFQGKLYVAEPGSGSPDEFSIYPQWTGYGVMKYCDPNFTGNLRNYGGNTIVIRYAEVLLGYLESQLEAGVAINQTLLDQTINKVRGRTAVNLPKVTTIDQTALRTIVRTERKVELAFEGLRLYDILRWGIAYDELNTTFTGLWLTNDPAHYVKYKVDNQGFYIYGKKVFVKGINERWPIPISEINVNKNLKQNPGY
ncbi:MAG: RagB/SusD family nutrient uptake outer membrane protein [Bacteroidetes bacterium]|nr:RagB/SusD family nutrient uptake outer membrane protein [Bacteroidota bacterium]